ncbi:hypothetical protein ACFFX1_04630 [Dactylosporangium sucinum]|uniref:Uncharacterized protein n=1 Tax=Dactylosporangium sucinum TaxID=1424081 RepID=A0A917X1X5_9ACTN|nr:hypothetical protein [Dactylosporangium sucinum]GGM59989.1 hypothetical protein GCM10007977_071920 [Dactylosporangium sucinum]
MTVGRHSLGRPGLERRGPAPAQVDPDGRRPAHHPRHRRERSLWQWTGEAMSLLAAVAVLALLAVSGWYTATGASAMAQMLAR